MNHKPISTTTFPAFMVKFLTGYLIFEAALYGGIPMVLGVAARRLALPLVLLFLPAVIFGPLLYYSSRYKDQPKLRSIWFSTAVAAFLLAFLPAVDFWAYSIGLINRALFDAYMPYAIAMAPVAALTTYYQAHRRFSMKNQLN